MDVVVKRARAVAGRIAAPPSKSMAHRAVLCAALAKGTSHLHHLAFSKDISATLGAAGRLCARVTTGENDAVVEGLGRFLPVDAPVDCCESGSTLRFLIPLASLTRQEVTFTGRGRLMERPQSVYKTLYQQQGLRFEQSADRLTVEGALTPGEYELAGNVSSQFISGLLFALPRLGGTSTLHLIPPVESRSYIDMTRAVQHAFGVESRWLDENTLEIPGGQHYLPCDYTVEGDYSQAAFPAVLGAVTGGVAITGLSEETLQGDAAILEILRRCGARFTRTGQGGVEVLQEELLGSGIGVKGQIQRSDPVALQKAPGRHAAGSFFQCKMPACACPACEQDDVVGGGGFGAQHKGAAHGPHHAVHKSILPQHRLPDLGGKAFKAAQVLRLHVGGAPGQQAFVLHVPQHLAAAFQRGGGGIALGFELGVLLLQQLVQPFLLFQKRRVQVGQGGAAACFGCRSAGGGLESAPRAEHAVHQTFPIIGVCHKTSLRAVLFLSV